MRVLQLQERTGPSGLVEADVDVPAPGPGEALVDVGAIGINFPDLLITRGEYQLRPDLPFVPGCELAGVVRDPGDTGLRAGDRIAAFVWQGAYAEQAVVRAEGAVRLPDAIDLETAAGMVVNYHTTHFALARRARLVAGETAFVLGAAGGIGTAAVQVARGLGAHVIGGVADEAQAAVATEAGAHEVVLLGEAFSKEVLERTGGRGVDVALDPLGDRFFGEALRTLAPEGRIAVVGFAAGEIPTLRVNRLLLRNADAVGVAWGAFLGRDDTLMARAGEALHAMVAAGDVRPHISEHLGFADIPAALERLARGAIAGKAVALTRSR